MSIEFLDNENAGIHNENKVHFFDLIAHIEDLLDDARLYGKSASTKLLTTIDRLVELEPQIEKLAKNAGESLPPKNYKHELDRISKEYLPQVIHHESQKIKDAIHNLGCLNDGCKKLIDNLSNSVAYYGEMYPELELSKYIDEIDTLCQNVPRVTRKSFFQRLFGN
jgi:hypothetical protein